MSRQLIEVVLVLPSNYRLQVIFIEGRPSSDVFVDTRMVFFTVYTYGALLAILLVIFATIALHYTRRCVNGKQKVCEFVSNQEKKFV